MILSALDAYYRRKADDPDDPLPPYGFALQKVVAAIQLDGDGRFQGLMSLQDADENGKLRPRLMLVPESPGRTVAVSAAFLCDNGGYLLGHDLKGKPERVRLQFAAATVLHREVLVGVEDPAARAILHHFESWQPEYAAEPLQPWAELLQGWLVFLVSGIPGPGYAHERPALREAWQRHVAAGQAKIRGQCLITGASDVPIARLHPGIKGAGGQSSGASLVSFNFDAANSYGKSQSYNAPVSEAAAFGYGTALNHLLRRDTRRSRTIGDTTVVVWAERPSPAEGGLLDYFDPPAADLKDDASPEDKARAVQVRDVLDGLIEGRDTPEFAAEKGVPFYLLGLSPNAARLSVRLWLTATLGELLDRIREHQRDMALIPDGPKRPRHPSLWSLVLDCRAKDADGKARGRADNDRLYKLHGDLLRAVLTGGPYPAALLPLLLTRFRSDGAITHPRVALIKAGLSRRLRLATADHQSSDRKELTMGLDETRTETGYLLGRLFAALERMQESALGKDINRTIRDKFIGAAAATPRDAFNHLLPLSESHRRKARRENPGGAVVADKVISRIMAGITGIPAVLPPDDQALFFVGYYQQRQDFFTAKPNKPKESDSAAETD